MTENSDCSVPQSTTCLVPGPIDAPLSAVKDSQRRRRCGSLARALCIAVARSRVGRLDRSRRRGLLRARDNGAHEGSDAVCVCVNGDLRGSLMYPLGGSRAVS
ncbi:hypothetical protein V5799_023754 [Amblyomma americanum]|uniref:Uncharacterized protein n=1 Tax=Amblyomma americanum TaxID=6943 RepID=A0AAQ4FIN8_AMBAM